MHNVRILLVMVLAVLTAGEAWAQRTSEPSMLILANNRGIFACTINLAIFNFGTVNADGTDFGTPSVTAQGRNASDDGGLYETTPGAIAWTCRAAPSSTVALALNSNATDHVGGLAADNLEARIQDTAGGTSAGYQPFSSQNNLITTMSVGNAGAAATGALDLRLAIFDTDPVGSDVWVVRLRASGTP